VFFSALEFATKFIKKWLLKSGKLYSLLLLGGLLISLRIGLLCYKTRFGSYCRRIKVELEPFNIKIATVNQVLFDTGFNDRGMDSIERCNQNELYI
jgi:hypothetical protein